ncbi:MAG: hypothetical protein ABI619_01590 [Betaproteobacteria bacterium]
MRVKSRNQPSFRIARGSSGLWEVVEEGIRGALALFRAPQSALSYACDLAAVRKGSVVMVFDRVRARERMAAHVGSPMPRLQ